MQELKNILEKVATISEFGNSINFFSFKQQLEKENIKSYYANTVYLMIEYKKVKYCLTSVKNADKSNNDILMFNDKYILGLI